MEVSKRDNYIDYLRLLVISLVVILHTAVTYSGVGNWYFIDATAINDISKLISAMFIIFTNAYTMSFLFLVAAYYSAKSYTKKTNKDFIKGRLYRLGLPVLLVMFFIYPLTMYFLYISGEKKIVKDSFLLYLKEYIVSGDFLSGTGPLWFAVVLLILSIIYAIIGKKNRVETKKLPDVKSTILAIIIIGTVSFVVRLVIPMDVEILNISIGSSVLYIAAFVIGIKAHQYNWFNQVKYNYAKKWLIVTLILGIISWLALIIFGGVLEHGDDFFKGGLYWQSYAYAVWESFLILGMSIGLLGFFRQKLNKENKFAVTLANNSFSVYVWHMSILVGVSLLMREITIYPLLKIVIVSSISLIVTFLLSHYVFRRIPLLKHIM